MNNEKHCSVIDAEGRHVTYVLVKIRDKPQHAGSTGFISPIWGGSDWQETATADEIAAWEQEHPAPEVKPSPKSNAELEAENATLRQQVSALADQQSFYEDCIAEMAEIIYA